MAMIKDRSEHTNKIIEEMQKIGDWDKISRLKLSDVAGVPTDRVHGYIASARRYLASNYQIHFIQIRKVGLQRLGPGGITENYPVGFKKGERHFKRLSKQLGDEKIDRLTKQQREAHTVCSVIDSNLRNSLSTRELTKNVEIAKIDGAERVLAAIASAKGREGK